MKRILFIDRDGTIVSETDDEKVDKIHKIRFLPEALYYLRKIHDELDYELVMVTNQDGLGTDDWPESEFQPAHDLILDTLKSEGIHFSAIHVDEHYPHDNHPNRKPGIGMLTGRSEEHTSELQSPDHLVCRLLLEKKKKKNNTTLIYCNRSDTNTNTNKNRPTLQQPT